MTSDAKTIGAGAAQQFILRGLHLACVLPIVVTPNRRGYVAAIVATGLVQFARSFTVAVREQDCARTLYVRAANAIAGASAMTSLPLPESEPELALGRALWARARLIAATLPTVLGEGGALLIVLLVLAATSVRSVIFPTVLGMCTGGAAYALLLRRASRREIVAQELFAALHQHVVLFLGEREERIAQSAGDRFVKDVLGVSNAHRRASLHAIASRVLVRRVPLALVVVVALSLCSLLHVVLPTDGASLLFAALVADGGFAFFLALAERVQLEKQAGPLLSVLALAPASLGGSDQVGACARIAGRDVAFSYDGSREVVSAFSFEVAPGEPLVLRGENGSGKSTVLKLVLGLGAPTSGDIAVDGKSLCELDSNAWHAQIAFVSQATPFDANADVRDAMRAIAPDLSDDALANALADLGLTPSRDWLTRKMGALSSGQRRRVQLARAFALDRRVLVLDEPEAGLDAATQKRVRDLVVRASKERLVIIATHSDLFDEGIRLSRTRDTSHAAPAIA